MLRHGIHQAVGEAFLQRGTREQIRDEVAQRHRPIVDAVANHRRNVVGALVELQLLLAAARLAFDWRFTVHVLDVLQLDL